MKFHDLLIAREKYRKQGFMTDRQLVKTNVISINW